MDLTKQNLQTIASLRLRNVTVEEWVVAAPKPVSGSILPAVHGGIGSTVLLSTCFDLHTSLVIPRVSELSSAKLRMANALGESSGQGARSVCRPASLLLRGDRIAGRPSTPRLP